MCKMNARSCIRFNLGVVLACFALVLLHDHVPYLDVLPRAG